MCIECAIAEKTGRTKKIAGAPIGNGARLLAYLKAEDPQLYAKLLKTIAAPDSTGCLECGIPLEDKRSDSDFCSDVHSKRYRRRKLSQTGRKRRNSPDTPVEKQGLTEAQNGGWTNDAAESVQAANSLEKMLCHQLAAAHVAAMRLIASSLKNTSLPPVEMARLANAAARMMQIIRKVS